MSRKNILITVAVVLVGAAVVAANLWYRRSPGTTVTAEAIKTRDLEAIVSASGKIQPKRLVNISADTSGRVVDLAVNEGDRIKKGQFLLQIDPKSLRTRVDSGTASLQAAEGSLDQLRQSVETARAQLDQAQKTAARQRDLWNQQLTTRESLEKADNDVVVGDVRRARAGETSDVSGRAHRSGARRLESARYDLSKVRIESPIDGIVTRRNIQEGETAVIGTMNNAGTVLLTLADMSVIQAEVEVDETNIPNVQLGQTGEGHDRRAPRPTFKGHVSEIGNSPIQIDRAVEHRHAGHQLQSGRDARRADSRRATWLYVHGRHHDRDAKERDRRADSRGCRRELVYDANNQVVKAPRTDKRRRRAERRTGRCRCGTQAWRNAQRDRRRVRGPRRQGRVRADQVGISGDKYFEVLDAA